LVQLPATIQFSTLVEEPVKFADVCWRTEAWPSRTCVQQLGEYRMFNRPMINFNV